MKLFSLLIVALASTAVGQAGPRVVRFAGPSTVEIILDGRTSTLRVGQAVGDWTLMSVVEAGVTPTKHYAILENFAHADGRILFVGSRGIEVDLPKSSESTSQDPAKLYLGHTIDEIRQSAADLLGEEILAKNGDPKYADVAAVFPPIGSKMTTYSFLGTPQTMDKVGFNYGGRTANFDPAPYYAPIAAIREKGDVRDGLVGGYLPILRFVYLESEGNWSEMLAFAPPRISNSNDRVQPVWYRVARIENHQLKWTQYVDSYHPFPPRTGYDPAIFYRDLLQVNQTWKKALEPSMKLDVPDERMANMARFALVREMMTRVHDYPKYGAVDKDYAGSEHDGFPDTFNVDTSAMLEWGLIELAGRYLDNYFDKFVRDDGSLLYRGPEVGQYGRMLTVVAQFVNYGGDAETVLKHRKRIDAIAKLLLMLRERAEKLPREEAAYGMIAGWSEADASLDADPARYMQPYFSNSTEAARGFRDLGRVWERLGKTKKSAELSAWGEKLQRESEGLERDIQTSISRSLLKVDGESILPAIAEVKQPFHVAVPADPGDPQFRSYRAYVEMMDSGILTDEQVKNIVNYRSRHHDIILGMPGAYGFNTGIMAGFLSYGHGYGLIQHDMIREALLMTYSDMAHQYTRGTWTAPETRSILPDQGIAPYCTPAQLVVSLMTKWLLVFEDPQSETVWLGKGIARDWLEDGKDIRVEEAPTRWGRVGFRITSQIASGRVTADVKLPAGFSAVVNLRLRAPEERRMKSVTVNGKDWKDFDARAETVRLPIGTVRDYSVVAQY